MEKQRPQPRHLAQHSDATSAFSPGSPRPEDPKSPAAMAPGGEVNGLAGELLGYAYYTLLPITLITRDPQDRRNEIADMAGK
ncbi:hypothetical protein BKA56DRAFT_582861 [Ilyonectria sp. MPI-CAGE-AT-0026]|nr:hypothetical protein BKA56DRAFT_582861 [Ilyonectria sp. MPI-CAGE-AT-0026]